MSAVTGGHNAAEKGEEGLSRAERKRRAQEAKQDLAVRKLVQEAVHRANLLGLLAHGLLLDRAADDPMVQVRVQMQAHAL